MGIPVTIHLDRELFNALERIAERRQVSMRELIASHIARSVLGVHAPTNRHGQSVAVTRDVIELWEQAAFGGVSNKAIAERWGVSKSLVSRVLIERGIRRQRNPRGSRQVGEVVQ